MELQEIQQLIAKYNAGSANPEEKTKVELWYAQIQRENPDLSEPEKQELKNVMFAGLVSRIERHESPAVKVKTLKRFRMYLPWAAIFIGISLIGYFGLRSKQHEFPGSALAVTNGIVPGTNKAILTLADGSHIMLDDAGNGKLASQGSTEIVKNNEGIVYTGKGASGENLLYNTIATPRGGKYQLKLPDGSLVWLNASSSLKFPAAFRGKLRSVELTGEAYFEIAKNAKMPFRVKTIGQTVEVLGTHFNVNAYPDEPGAVTTLLEGSVKILKGTASATLKPGEEAAVLNSKNGNIAVREADVEEATAWKNGMFQFNQSDIKTIMRQISRWYDVDIAFEGNISTEHYRGKVSRHTDIKQVLQILELSGVKFKIEGKKIIVK